MTHKPWSPEQYAKTKRSFDPKYGGTLSAYTRQIKSGKALMLETHAALICDGYTHDGMDGYYKIQAESDEDKTQKYRRPR